MADDKTPLAQAVRELAARDRELEETAISPDELLAYHHGDLSIEQAEELRERLAMQPDAVRTLQDLSRFPDIEPVDEGRRLDPSEVDAEWQAMRTRLAAELDSDAETALPFRRPAAGRRWPVQWLAAALLLVCLGLSWWIVSLRQTVRELAGARINVLVSSLVPETTVRDTEPVALSFPAASEHLLLILNLSNLEQHSDYRIAISTDDGVILSWDGLEKTPLSNFTVEIPRTSLPPGDYRIDLSGLEGTRWQTIATYSLRIRSTSRD